MRNSIGFANFQEQEAGSKLGCPGCGSSRLSVRRQFPAVSYWIRSDASRVYRELGRRGLLVRVCDSFHGMPKGRFIRVAVRTEEDNHLLARELAAICVALNRRAA
jgi:hypothetical protein